MSGDLHFNLWQTNLLGWSPALDGPPVGAAKNSLAQIEIVKKIYKISDN